MKVQMIVAAALLCVALAPMAAPDAAPLQPLMTGWERYFRLEWNTTTHQERPVVYGHVRNEWAPQYRVSVFAFDWMQRGRGLN